MEPVRANGLCECLALLLTARQTVLFTARTRAGDPFRLTVGPYPVWRDHRQRIEGLPQCLPDAFPAVEGADRGQYMGRVRALAPPRREPLALTEAVPQGSEQLL